MSSSYSNSYHSSEVYNEKYDLSARGLSDLSKVNIPPVLYLKLSNNQFTNLSSLPQNDELKVLQADNNKIEVLQPSDFDQCSSLSNLNLSFNFITKIPTLNSLQSLKSLELAGNQITVLENIEGLPNLQKLLLSKNKIHSVVIREQIPSLMKLDLRTNDLSKIQFGNCFPSLVSLHLDHCFLSSFSGLNEMKSLRRLTLSFNKINDSQPLDLPNLEYLNVSNNALNNIQSFIKLINITVLNISFNPIDDQGLTISTKFSNLRSLIATGTRIVHPNLILRFAPNVENLELANTRVSQLQDVQALVRKATNLQNIDLRGVPLTHDYYPSIEGQTVEAREDYDSIEKYDSDYPETAVPRNQYRKSVLSCVLKGSLKKLDGILISTKETNIINSAGNKKQKKNYEEESENEPYDSEINNSNHGNKYNDTDELVSHLEKKNADLKTQKLYLQQESMLESIEQLLGEQDQLRAQLNLPPNDDMENQDDLRQYSLNQLAEYKQKIQDINQSLVSKIYKKKNNDQINADYNRNLNTSDVLNQEKERNKTLRKELKKIKEMHNQASANDDYKQNTNENNDVTNAINELQQENQRLSHEMIKARNHHHRSHHYSNQNQEIPAQVDSPSQKRRNNPTYSISNQQINNENNRSNRNSNNHGNRNSGNSGQTNNNSVRRNRNYDGNNRKDKNSRNDDYEDYEINRKPPDPSKIHLAEQLMAENALLRNTLGLDPLNYHPAESFNSADIDKIIVQLLDHNKIMREQVTQQSQFKNGVRGKRPVPTQQMARYLQYLDLQGSREGCTFWVPLDAKKQKEQQDNYNNMQMRLPIPVEINKKKKKQLKGCSKCEKAILMMSRVPIYPPDASKIYEDSDEFQLVESWIITSLNKKVRIADVMKSSFYYKIIENERTMHNIHLFVITTNEPIQYLTDGIDQPILLADHFKYVAKELKKSGSAQILICAFDVGNQATNYCEHTIIPNIQEMKSMNPSFDSLRFIYQDEEAIMALDPSRVVPIYAVQVSEIE